MGIFCPALNSASVGMVVNDARQMADSFWTLSRDVGIFSRMRKTSDEDGSAKSFALKMIACPPSRKRRYSEESACSASRLAVMLRPLWNWLLRDLGERQGSHL